VEMHFFTPIFLKKVLSMSRNTGFPDVFLDRLGQIVPAEALSGVLASMAADPGLGFRVNTLRCTTAHVLADIPCPVSPLAWINTGFAVAPEHRKALLESAAFAKGWIWVQNPSSMVPPLVLNPAQSDVVLDLAAAPGSKTLQLACAMGPGADIAAVEMVKPRFYRLKRNLSGQGAAFVKTFNRDGTTVPLYRSDHFDCVLIDAPCSTEGQMRPDTPASYGHWSERKVKTMAGKQRRLLESAVRCAKPGGAIVYSTCSYAPEENEAVVQHALDTFGEALEVEPIELELPTRTPPLTTWRGQDFDPAVSNAMRVLPDGTFEAFFVCRLRKAT
jgi:16S rRNA C967 or C1407 C5-methylase (RsmB/RsmF family)